MRISINKANIRLTVAPGELLGLQKDDHAQISIEWAGFGSERLEHITFRFSKGTDRGNLPWGRMCTEENGDVLVFTRRAEYPLDADAPGLQEIPRMGASDIDTAVMQEDGSVLLYVNSPVRYAPHIIQKTPVGHSRAPKTIPNPAPLRRFSPKDQTDDKTFQEMRDDLKAAIGCVNRLKEDLGDNVELKIKHDGKLGVVLLMEL